MKKKVSVMVPCYNEVGNVEPIAAAIVAQMEALPQYDFELLFIDNCSTDGTRDRIRALCAGDRRIRAIFNVKNFGQFNSPFHALLQTTGDCAISICADFQDPVEMIPDFLRYWEEGYQIVCGVKTSSQESHLIYRLRTLYYRLLRRFSSVDIIEHFTGFGLYDRSFLDVLRRMDDPTPFLRGMVAELGGRRKEIPYEQPLRRSGKTHNNWYTLYDAAMLSVTSYTKAGMRLAVFGGAFFAVMNLLVGLVYLIMKLIYWDRFEAGQAPSVIITSLMGSILLCFMGFLGEYISAINIRQMHRPLVVEEERLNFDEDGRDGKDGDHETTNEPA